MDDYPSLASQKTSFIPF